MTDDKDWAAIRKHAVNAARKMGIPFSDIEDAAQFACERLWIDGDWKFADSTVIHNKLIDWVRMQTGRRGQRLAVKSQMIYLDDELAESDGVTYHNLIGKEDNIPCLRVIPQVPYQKGTPGCSSNDNVDITNFILAAVAWGVPQKAIADFLDITESAVCHRLKIAAKHIERDDLLP